MAASYSEIGAGIAGSSATTYQLTLTTSAAIGDLVVVSASNSNTNTLTSGAMTDSQGNTWTLAAQTTQASATRAGIWYSVLTVALTGGTDWVKLTTSAGSNSWKTIKVTKLAGGNTISLDKTNSTASQPSGTTLTPGTTGALAQAKELAVVLYQYANVNSPTFTAPSGWSQTATTQQIAGGTTVNDVSTSYLLTAATTALNPSATISQTNTWGACIATFKYSDATVPVNTVAPAVTGTTTVGQVLTTTNGTWTDDGSPTFTYQWQRDNTGGGSYSNISSATASTYTLVDADDACNIRCNVTDSTPDGNTTQASNAVGVVAEPVATNSVAPTVSGSAPQGSTLTAANGTWAHMGGTVATYTYQWTRAGSNITGATASTYQTVNADVGSAIGVKVVATNTGGSSSAVASSNTVTPTTAGFHSGTLTMQFPVVADIVAEWSGSAGVGALLLLGVG